VALANIDEVIALIKAAPTPADAKVALMAVPGARPWSRRCSPAPARTRRGRRTSRPASASAPRATAERGQAQAILDLRLQRLTGLEQDKIIAEYGEILARIAELLEILSSPDRLMAVIRGELLEVKEQFGDKRRTEILYDHLDLTSKT